MRRGLGAPIWPLSNGNGGSLAKRAKREAAGDGADDRVNVYKAVRFASGGQGAAALARKSVSNGRQKWKGKL
jgi:hypothetical protein